MQPLEALAALASILVGIVLLLAGLVLLFTLRRRVEGDRGAEGVGIVLLGPVPVVLRGSGWRAIVIAAAIAVTVFLLLVMFMVM